MDEAAIRDILTSSESHTVIANRYGRSASTISQIRRGKMHANVAQELPRWDLSGRRGIRRICSNCQYWTDGRCDLGFPDPKEEGMWFARDCSMFTKQAG